MARRHVGGFNRSRGPKRSTSWVGPADQGFIAVAAGAKQIISSLPVTTDITLVRSRGEVGIQPQVNTDVIITGAYGMAVVTDQAFAAGVASLPGPLTDADWDGWAVWRSFAFQQVQLDATGTLLSTIRQEVDSKAMRKLTDNETLVVIAESQATAFEISFGVRTLFKLH